MWIAHWHERLMTARAAADHTSSHFGDIGGQVTSAAIEAGQEKKRMANGEWRIAKESA
jgi:hypothetical protein